MPLFRVVHIKEEESFRPIFFAATLPPAVERSSPDGTVNSVALRTLRRAAMQRNTSEAEKILESGLVDVDAEIYDYNEYIAVTAFFISAYLGDCATAELLLDWKADINYTATNSHQFQRPFFSSRTHTAVALAGEHGDDPMVRMLLRRGADVDIDTVDQEGYAWSASIDGGMWSRVKRASYWRSIKNEKARALGGLMEEHSAASKLNALETSVLAEALEDDGSGLMELTPAMTQRLLDNIIAGGCDSLETIMEQWGFEDQLGMERVLRAAVAKDTTGHLSWKFDKCLSVLTRNLSLSDLLFDGDFTAGGTGG